MNIRYEPTPEARLYYTIKNHSFERSRRYKNKRHLGNKHNYYSGKRPHALIGHINFELHRKKDTEIGYIGDISDLETPKFLRRKGFSTSHKVPAETIFDHSKESKEIQSGGNERVKTQRLGMMRIILAEVEKKYLGKGLDQNKMKTLTDEFLLVFGTELAILYKKFKKNKNTYKPRHISACQCNLCTEFHYMHNFMTNIPMSHILEYYFNYIHWKKDNNINIGLIFDPYQSKTYNMRVLFRKLERKYQQYEKYEKYKKLQTNKNDLVSESSESRKRLDMIGNIDSMSPSLTSKGMEYI